MAMVTRSPKNLRSNKFSKSQPIKSIITNTRNQEKVQSLNETFQIKDQNAEVLSQNLSFNGLLKADEVQKLSTDEKITLIVNKAIDVMNMFYEMKDTMTKYESAIEKLCKENSVLVEENNSMKKRMLDLESNVHCKDNDNVKSQEEGMILKYERLKQNLKQDECEFWGVDELPDEDLTSKVIEIASQFNTIVSPKDIAFVTRKKTNITTNHGIPRTIRVKFYNRFIRDKLVKEGKTLRVARSNELDQRNGRSFIYINEALTKHMEYIFGKTRELKRKKVISRTWCKQGRVFIQWGNHAPKIVERIEDLDGFK